MHMRIYFLSVRIAIKVLILKKYPSSFFLNK